MHLIECISRASHFQDQLSSDAIDIEMGNSLSAMISRIRTFYVGAQEGKDSISMVDKVTDVQLLQFHEAFSFFDKVCA